MATLGVDFGTSNSAVGAWVDGAPVLIPIEDGAHTLPTAVFFDFDAQRAVYGQRATAALIAGEDGRFMRALKSLLGTSLMRESRMLLGERLDFIEIVGRFLGELKRRAEAATGQRFDHALSGRPVLFHSGDAARNAQALVDLTACYQAAGFDTVSFLPEPEAAALANRARLTPGDLGLVVDIGGGTSDFTLFRQGQGAGIDVLASHGLRLGGTNFDRALSLATVMPALGMGSRIRHAFGSDTHSAPNALFHDLATWEKIPFLYTPPVRRAAAELAQFAQEPAKLRRLVRVLDDELGHDLAFAVEAAKIAANADQTGTAQIDLQVVEAGWGLPLPRAGMTATLAPMAQRISDAALETLRKADVAPDAVDCVIFVGGTSLMTVVEQAVLAPLPRAVAHRGAALTAIVEGLVIAAGG